MKGEHLQRLRTIKKVVRRKLKLWSR